MIGDVNIVRRWGFGVEIREINILGEKGQWQRLRMLILWG